MDDIKDGAKGGFRRVELLTGPGRRRQWTAAEKARIVAESLAPGAVVSDVAHRWRIAPQQLSTWRRQARAAALETPVAGALSFVTVVGDAAAPVPSPAGGEMERAAVEVEIAGAVVRVSPGVGDGLLTAVLRAVRASSA